MLLKNLTELTKLSGYYITIYFLQKISIFSQILDGMYLQDCTFECFSFTSDVYTGKIYINVVTKMLALRVVQAS